MSRSKSSYPRFRSCGQWRRPFDLFLFLFLNTHTFLLSCFGGFVMVVIGKIEDNLLFCRGECEGGIIDGSVDDVDVAAFGWSIMCPDDYQL